MKFIDLTLTIEEGMITFPVHWHPMVEISVLGRLDYEKRETRKLVLGTHTGTHMDAPRHFIKGGRTIDQISLEQLCGKALLLDFSDAPEYHEVSKNELKSKLAGRTPKKLILRYGWDKNILNNDYYVAHPFLSEEAAQFLIDIGLELLAQDTPMPDNPKNGKGTANDSPNHTILLGNDCVLVEYLINLDQIKTTEVELFVLPLKIKDGDGSPIRCMAREIPDTSQ